MLHTQTWVEDGQSADATLQNIDHVVPAGQTPYLLKLQVSTKDGNAIPWTLERPAGTVVLQGHGPTSLDFFGTGEGWAVPGADGADLRLAIAAGAIGINTRGFMIGADKLSS